MSTTAQMAVWLAMTNDQAPFIRTQSEPDVRIPVLVTDVVGMDADGMVYVSVAFRDPHTGRPEVASVYARGLMYDR